MKATKEAAAAAAAESEETEGEAEPGSEAARERPFLSDDVSLVSVAADVSTADFKLDDIVIGISIKKKEEYNNKKCQIIGVNSKNYRVLMLEGPQTNNRHLYTFANVKKVEPGPLTDGDGHLAEAPAATGAAVITTATGPARQSLIWAPAATDAAVITTGSAASSSIETPKAEIWEGLF